MHLTTIRDESNIYACVGDAKVPHVSAFDIGNVAFVALTQTEPPYTDYRILGPELLTFNEVITLPSSSPFTYLSSRMQSQSIC